MDDKLAKMIGSGARAARQALGLTQEDAADATGISSEFYGRIERGKTLPSVPTLVQLAAALRISTDSLLGLERASAPQTRSHEAPGDAGARKLLRRILRAKPSTIRLVTLLLREIEAGRRRSL
jgi:transcriptional regulator with XRE-family HTH domain